MRKRDWLTPATGPRGTLRPMLLCALFGALNVFAFAPYGFWVLQAIALAFLFYQVGLDTQPRRSFWLGFAYGFGWTVAGMHWIYISMHRYGGMPPVLAAAGVALFGAYIGLFNGAATAMATWLRGRWSLPVAAFFYLTLPACWALSEWLRGWLFTGYPGGAIGYAYVDHNLGGLAPLLGVYGVSLAAAVFAGAGVMLVQGKKHGAVVMTALLAVGMGYFYVNWTSPHGKPIDVRLLQGNIDQDIKFDPAHVAANLEVVRSMVTAKPADLIVAPETAIPVFPHNLPPGYLDSLGAFARSSGSHIVYGIPLMDGESRYANSVVGISPLGQSYRYDKHHLMPFGEFVPTGFRWFVDTMQIPLGDFTRGAAVQVPMAVKDQWVLPNICYEDLFGEEIATQLRDSAQPATILLNVSNLAWFGDSLAAAQHLQISRMRALETGRPMLRATNTGATAVIGPKGELWTTLPSFKRDTLRYILQGREGMTPYIRFGNLPFLLLAVCLLLGAWYSGRTVSLAAQRSPSPNQQP